MLCLGIALTENEPVAVQDILAVIRIHGENVPCDLRQLFLFLGHRHSLEDTIVTTADTICLIVGEMTVLRHFCIVHSEVSSNAVNSGGDICFVQSNGSFRNDVAHAVTDEDFHSNTRIFCFLVCQVDKRTGDSVRHLIRVARIYFFKHGKHLPIEVFVYFRYNQGGSMSTPSRSTRPRVRKDISKRERTY